MQQGVAGCNNLMQGYINIVFVTVYTRAEPQFWNPYRDFVGSKEGNGLWHAMRLSQLLVGEGRCNPVLQDAFGCS